MIVQRFLETNSLAALRDAGVKTSAKVGDWFFSLNYDQIESVPGPMTNQCRGLILGTYEPLTEEQVSGTSPVGRTMIYARPFDRFFNLGDSNAAKIDLNDPRTVFFEKLDGTCCIVWWNPMTGRWCVATRAVPLADKPMTGWDDLTFSGLFKKALRETLIRGEMIRPDTTETDCFQFWTRFLDKENTYVFELTTPLNRIVVDYSEYTVWLLGIRNTQTGEEQNCNDYARANKTFAGVPFCPSHKINSLSELISFVASKTPFEQEGIVVCDSQFRRVKVKSLAYTAYNRVRDSAANSPRALVELILTERLDDVMPVLEPYIQGQATKLQDGIRNLFRTMDHTFQEILAETNGQENQRKAFALGVQARKAWMTPLMDRFTGKCTSFQAWIDSKKNADGSYPDSLLDNLISLCNTPTNNS